MNKKFNQSIYRILVLCEFLAITSAGIVVDLLKDLINISPTSILFGSVFIILICFFVTIQRLQYENQMEPNHSFGLKSRIRNLSDEIIKREAFIFPVALLVGIVIGFASTTLFPKEELFILQTRWFGQYRYLSWHDYEVFSYPLALITIFLLDLLQKSV